jgi:NTP pyrophosphatase (non-canonical NTP hydrolase)
MADAPYSLTLDEYQREALRTAPKHLDDELRRATYALGLSGESGEVAELVKKEVGHDHETDRSQMAKELGDVLWYLAGLASEYGWSLSQIGQLNIEKLRSRYPEGFDTQKSKNRKKGDT